MSAVVLSCTVQRVLLPPPPPPAPPPVLELRKSIRRQVLATPAPQARPEPAEERSAWEPSSPYEGSRCKALLLEVLRRAAHDWVLYRGHARLPHRECAEDAYTWLFDEHPGHAAGRERAAAVFDLDEGPESGVRVVTSFLEICEALDLDPETVRARVRQMDVKTIISAGRPAETRRVKRESSSVEEHGVTIGVNVDVMPRHQTFETQYESYGTIATPDMLSINDMSGYY